MYRLAQLSILLTFCCVYCVQPQASPASEAKPTGAALSPNDPGYIEEDPILARLIGKPAPALTLKSIDGKSINLSDLYGKRPVYLKLWATYCIPCRVQMPGLRNIFTSYGNEMAVIAVKEEASPELEKIAEDAEAEVSAALFDDLNAPIALGALFTFIRRANAELDRNGIDKRALEAARAAFARINSVLDVVPEAVGPDPELARWVEDRITARKDARARREFAEADRIRAEIEARGVAIEDTPQGTKWKIK
jgi:thiol-disulfide isomerase/thioredoxin